MTSFASAPDRMILTAAITWLCRKTSRKSSTAFIILSSESLGTPIQCS